jgi:CubicO group peptidase (beta-lactamase class C family)/lysophospholipase L1-like esterase
MTRRRNLWIWALTLLSVSVAALPSRAQQASGESNQSHWVATWGAAPQLTEPRNLPPEPGLAGNTLRQVAHVSIGGELLRVRFSNAFGSSPVTIVSAHIAASAGGSAIQPETDKALTFHGDSAATIAPGQSVFSDPCAFKLAPLSDLAVTVLFGPVSPDVTGHPGARCTSYLLAGAPVSAPDMPTAATTTHWYILAGVDVLADTSVGAVVAIGDSITDGRGTTTDQNRRWTDFLARRLQANKILNVAVVNQGIGGNCVLRGGLGPTALDRLERDVLDQGGARWLIVLEGVNDIGTSAGDAQAKVADELIAAYEQIIARAHAHDIRVYGATILPFGESFYFSPEHEAARQAVNQWIRSGGKFDAVIDFDAAIRDPNQPSRLLEAADSGDHLHLCDRGYEMMADAIDLRLFGSPAEQAPAEPSAAALPAPLNLTAAQDHQKMMELLGITSLRPGADPNHPDAPNAVNYDESKANPWPDLPDPLILKNGQKVTSSVVWWRQRRPEIVEDFDREIYGRVPKNAPKVNWEVTATTQETIGETPAITKQLAGHVDNSSYPLIAVDIQLTLTTPAQAKGPVPVMMEFGFARRPDMARPANAPPPPPRPALPGPNWRELVLAKGWGYAIIVPTSVQADNGAGLTKGVIGLCNQGQLRKADDWGALRAWAWGASRALDYLETDKSVDATQVGIEGLSRYGKAALVTMAYDQRFAIGFIGSSGEGGAKLHRRTFGELVENLTGSGEYHWMAGNFLKYGGPLNAGDLPVDAHELIALCAPRPVFISYGAAEGPGAEGKWVDQRGSFMAEVAAGPVYRLLGRKDLGTSEFPPIETALVDGDLAFRQHSGGHTTGPNWPTFLQWADRYIKDPSSATAVTPSEIQRALQDRLEKGAPGIGIVVGVLDSGAKKIYAVGEMGEGHRAPDGDTMFEIGSVTKVFTSTALAEMVQRGEVSLDDPISRFLPAGQKTPEWNGRPITLVDLATHTSGLPRLPTNLTFKDPANPYADYTVEQLYSFLGSATLLSEPGARYTYSNLGAGLLGHILGLRAGTDFESLIKARICRPLGMTDTTITLSPEQAARFAGGHNGRYQPAGPWDLPTLAGAGALRSSANDMLKFLAANLGLLPSTLDSALTMTHTRRKEAEATGFAVGLGWHIRDSSGQELLWHNGQTGGYHSFIGINPKDRRAVVILYNCARDIDDIGFHILDSQIPLRREAAIRLRQEISLGEDILRRYIGQYRLTPASTLTIRQRGKRLFAQATGQNEIEIFPESEKEFFYKFIDAQLTFESGPGGDITAMVLHQDGQDTHAPRISETPPAAPRELALKPEVLDRYLGSYQLAPGMVLIVTREGDQLMAQSPGQPKYELFAQTETDFFYKAISASITFVINPATGKAASLILRLNGNHQARKLE